MTRMGAPPCPLLHPGKLESAINRPRWAAHYEGANLVRQAVLLAVGISQAQAFEEGNKRAGFASADAFLRLNGSAFVGDSIGCQLFPRAASTCITMDARTPAGSRSHASLTAVKPGSLGSRAVALSVAVGGPLLSAIIRFHAR